jgi:hypothetical protein
MTANPSANRALQTFRGVQKQSGRLFFETEGDLLSLFGVVYQILSVYHGMNFF